MDRSPLDEVRAEYVRQIIERVCNKDGFDAASVVGLVDSLVMEWGAKAYKQGRRDMAERVKKCGIMGQTHQKW